MYPDMLLANKYYTLDFKKGGCCFLCSFPIQNPIHIPTEVKCGVAANDPAKVLVGPQENVIAGPRYFT